MTQENDGAALYRAAEIKKDIAELQWEYDMLVPSVIKKIKELSADKDKYALKVGDLGIFTVAKYRTWTYSSLTQGIEDGLKETKKKEEADGTATCETKDSLRFNAAKN